MADTFTKSERSNIMSKVRSKGNVSTEIKLIEIFKENHIKGWRRHWKITGKPDFAFPKHKIAVFADGCFWHGHNCRNTKPKSNKKYWETKIKKNKLRDKNVKMELKHKQLTVIRIWECEINNKKLNRKISRLKKLISF